MFFFSIFSSLQLGKLSNISLFLRLCACWFIDVIILSTWAAIDPLTKQLKMIDEEAEDNDDDVTEELLIHQCTSKYYVTWMMSICGFKGILLIFGVFLAWETRNVTYPSLNDSKNIGLAVYNVFMFSCLAIVTEFVVTYPPLQILVVRCIVFVGTTSTISLLFVPKILRLGKQNQIDSMSVTEPSRSEFETRGATNSEMRIETYKSKS